MELVFLGGVLLLFLAGLGLVLFLVLRKKSVPRGFDVLPTERESGASKQTGA